jgi:hypothetical protein
VQPVFLKSRNTTHIAQVRLLLFEFLGYVGRLDNTV